MNDRPQTGDSPEPRKSLLEEADGNWLQAGVMYFDRLPLPRPLRSLLKGMLIVAAALTTLCALLWPLVMRLL